MMTRTPSRVSRVPASRSSRVRTFSGNDGDCRTSKRSWTAVASLLTFCPPGPEARTKLSSISRSSMPIWSVTRITARHSAPVRVAPLQLLANRVARVRHKLRASCFRPVPAVLFRGCSGSVSRRQNPEREDRDLVARLERTGNLILDRRDALQKGGDGERVFLREVGKRVVGHDRRQR